MKAYSSRSNAKRAALVAFPQGNFDIVEIDGGFTAVQKVVEVEASTPLVELGPWPFPKSPVAPHAATMHNGVRQPRKGVCAQWWAWFAAQPAPLTVAQVRAAAVAQQLNVNNAVLEFYAWRKFNA